MTNEQTTAIETAIAAHFANGDPRVAKLLTKGTNNAKTAKSDAADADVLTMILYLAPFNLSGHQVCAAASAGCAAACLNTAGRGKMTSVQRGRLRRTKLWFTQREVFKGQILRELLAFVRKCDKLGKRPAVRMNGTSDLLWEKQWPELFELFPMVQFYDYTKHAKRCKTGWKLPKNYHLTFSRSETNDADCLEILRQGRHNVAVVFDSKTLPAKYRRFRVFNADKTDLRFLDPGTRRGGGMIAGLYAKGDAKRDDSGFVVAVKG